MATSIRGLAYPLQVKNGTFVLATDVDLIGDAILSIVSTATGERVMRTEYGVVDRLFTSITDFGAVIAYYQSRIEAELGYSGVALQLNGSFTEDGLMQIQIFWAVDGLPQEPITYKLT